MSAQLGRKEVEERLGKDYTAEGKLVQKLGEEKARKLVRFLSEGELYFNDLKEVALPKFDEVSFPKVEETNYDNKVEEVVTPKGPDANIKTPESEMQYPYGLRFSFVRDNPTASPHCKMDVLKNNIQIGYSSFDIEGALSIHYLGVNNDVENRLEIGQKMVEVLEGVAKEAGMKSVTMGRYYPLEGEFRYEELYEKAGYEKYQTDRFPELWKTLPEASNEIDDEDEMDL